MVPRIAELTGHHRRRHRRRRAGRVRQARRRPRQAAHRRAAHDRRAVGRGGHHGAGRVHRLGPGQGRPRLEEGSAEAARSAGSVPVTTIASAAARRSALRWRWRGWPPARPVRSSGPATPTTWPARWRARSRPPPRARSLAFLVLAGAGGTAARRVRPRRLARPVDAAGRRDHPGGGRRQRARARQQGRRTPNGELVGRDLATGAVLWQHPFPSSEHLYGYALDGDSVCSSSTRVATHRRQAGRAPGGLRRAHRARCAGSRRCRRRASAAPAARGGAGRGAGGVAVRAALRRRARAPTLGQVLSTEEAATFVRALPEGLFYGSRGVFLLGRDTARGSRHSPGYLAAQLPAFVRPTYDYDHYRPEQNEYSALDRNRVLWRVTVDDGRPQFRDGLAFVHDYRFFFAFDATTARAALGLRQPRRTRSRRPTPGRSILFVTAAGELAALDPLTGARIYQAGAAGRGGAGRHLRRRGVHAARDGAGRQHAARSAGDADGDHRRSRSAVPGARSCSPSRSSGDSRGGRSPPSCSRSCETDEDRAAGACRRPARCWSRGATPARWTC